MGIVSKLALLGAAGAALLIAGCATTQSPIAISDPPVPKERMDYLTMMGRPPIADLARRIADAAQYPLGSAKNPVRVDNPEGQRAYLSHLRCSDGKAPTFDRTGNLGPGVFGTIVDNYRVVCATGAPRESAVIMDMYHPGHKETGAPPGFIIVL